MTEKTCVSCGGSFTPKNSRKLACSDDCTRTHRRMNEARCRQRTMEQEKDAPEPKRCHQCRKTLPPGAFGKNRWGKDGLQRQCRACRGEYDRSPGQVEQNRERKAAWYQLHYEETRQKQNERYNTDEEFRCSHREDGKKRYHADPHGWVDRARERRQEQRRLEREDARRCFCGRALPAETEEGPWFCRPSCKADCLRQILMGAGLKELLWRLRSRSDEQRLGVKDERLILYIAKNTAARWAGRGSTVDNADLVSAAYLGAWNAWLSFDSRKGASLKTWLIYGARREVLELLRASDVLTRKEREEYRAALAADPKTPVPRRVVSLETVLCDDPEGDSITLFDRLEGEQEDTEAVLERVSARQTAAQILGVFKPSQARTLEVVRLVGMEGWTYSDVGKRLGVSESRVAQLWEEAKAQIVAEVRP